jgi:hypothetical protein
MASDTTVTSQTAGGNGSTGGNVLAAIKALKDQHPELGLREAKAIFDGKMTLPEALRKAAFTGPVPNTARSPSTAAHKALQRRYLRLLAEIAQILARTPTGTGKRLRGRVAHAAELFAELRVIVAQIREGGASI